MGQAVRFSPLQTGFESQQLYVAKVEKGRNSTRRNGKAAAKNTDKATYAENTYNPMSGLSPFQRDWVDARNSITAGKTLTTPY